MEKGNYSQFDYIIVNLTIIDNPVAGVSYLGWSCRDSSCQQENAFFIPMP
jgi:hypothetical protein